MTDLTWVLSSCVLIGAVIAIRAAFGGRMRPELRYALWGLVLLRLLVPVQLFTAPWGVAAELPKQLQWQLTRKSLGSELYADIELPMQGYSQVGGALFASEEDRETWERFLDRRTKPENVPEDASMFALYGPETAEATWSGARWSVADVLLLVWRAGIAMTAVVFLASNLHFYRTLHRRRKPLDADCPLRVYSVESLSSSCLFGNAIYVAAETTADETRLRHVLAHELSHHRHGDHVWTLLRCVALALHWYNPLVWWAAALSRQDSELCADAGALKRLGEDERENYGATLIELSARRAKRASLLCTATTMTNGKKSLRERVTMIARRPRMTVAVVIAVVLIAAVAAGCAFAGAASAPMTEEEALDALEESVTLRSDDQGVSYVAFTLPEAYGRAEDWDIHIAGRAVYPDGMSKSAHEYELFPDVYDWEAGREYTIRSDNLTELTFQVTLTGQDGKLHERGFDVFLPEFVIEESANAGQTVRWNGDRDSVNSVTLWSAGREFTAEEPESIGQVLDVIGGVVFTCGGDANAPGAQSLVATIRCRDGAEERVTFPCWERDGVTYDAGADSIGRFASFFANWPEPQKEELAGAENTESGGESLRYLLARLSPSDVRLRYYADDGLRGSADGASALMASNYLTAFAEIEWTEADPMDEADRTDDWHIELDGPGWRLISFQSSRRVLVEASGEELWLIARDISDAQYSWISYATLENWYLDALAAERYRAGGTPLTGEDLAMWREELAATRNVYDETWGGYTGYATMVSCFFSSHYADPRDLDLAEFLAYCPLSEAVEDEAEFDALNLDWEIEDENGVRRSMTLDRMPVPTHRYRVSRINDALMQYAGITLDDLSTDWRHDARMLYVPEYDAFYNFTSDFGPGMFEPRYGERSGDIVTLWGDSAVLRLQLTDGGYHILSHLPSGAT